MLPSLRTMILALWLLPSQLVGASELPGVSFSHHDWELVCDNTRTCRAVGYQSEGGYEDEEERSEPLALLLTRKAGPGQPLSGELMIGRYDEDEPEPRRAKRFPLTMWVNGRAQGTVLVTADTMTGTLSAAQVKTVLGAMVRNGSIAWGERVPEWTLSGKGAAAVFLKMDEFQGRLGTPGAIMRKGSKPESTVLPLLPVPVVKAAPVPAGNPVTRTLSDPADPLLQALRATISDEDCPNLSEGEAVEVTLSRLSTRKWLASTHCWLAAYNSGTGYWVINAEPPYAPMLVMTNGTDYSNGAIFLSMKSRGIGDCWSSEEWVWTGSEFRQTSSSSTGMCKMVAAGGAWSLPLLVMDVQRSGVKK